jgi:hypothetical protein
VAVVSVGDHRRVVGVLLPVAVGRAVVIRLLDPDTLDEVVRERAADAREVGELAAVAEVDSDADLAVLDDAELPIGAPCPGTGGTGRSCGAEQ